MQKNRLIGVFLLTNDFNPSSAIAMLGERVIPPPWKIFVFLHGAKYFFLTPVQFSLKHLLSENGDPLSNPDYFTAALSPVVSVLIDLAETDLSFLR
jgi:hypothetical protein